jgi:hypothetical protein
METFCHSMLIVAALTVPAIVILKWRRFGFLVGALLFPLIIYPAVEVQFARRPILTDFWPVVVVGGGFIYALAVLGLRSLFRAARRRFSQ